MCMPEQKRSVSAYFFSPCGGHGPAGGRGLCRTDQARPIKRTRAGRGQRKEDGSCPVYDGILSDLTCGGKYNRCLQKKVRREDSVYRVEAGNQAAG